ncbi:hypothetical protein NDU88_005333 [Pleurodeles waltl]|uniref:Uncharacterized protein n=1 Tax=Pleurodeles waltl TaxID=8319 RepID=A0AAV7LKU6_PLEWA|nr:hypothetical protein NDU88_005333 [Pleurodeles waltl]
MGRQQNSERARCERQHSHWQTPNEAHIRTIVKLENKPFDKLDGRAWPGRKLPHDKVEGTPSIRAPRSRSSWL